jgi:CRISPR-associated protein Cas2
MWLMVMFDLPVVDPSDRKAASDFRLELLDLGFEMSQFSVYLRFCSSQAQVETLSKRIENSLPSGGKVSLLQFTDKQYGRVVTYQRSIKEKKSEPPSQYLLL